MANTESTSTAEKQAAKHTPEAEALADSILRPSGSNLRNYTLPKTRDAILSAAQKGIDDAQAELLTALKFTREWFTENDLDGEYYSICEHLDEAIAKATERAA